MTLSTDDTLDVWPANTAEEEDGVEPVIPESASAVLNGEIVTESPDKAPETIVAGPLPGGVVFPSMAQAVMLKDLRSWAWWLIGFGVLNLVLAGIDGIGWAWVLFMVGAASFIFKDAVLYILYTVTLAWAGVSNLISGQNGWIFFSFLQFYMAFQTYRNYRRYQQVQDDITRLKVVENTPTKHPWLTAPKLFPWLGGLLGIGSLAGLLLTFILLFTISLLGAQEPSDTVFLLAIQFVVNAGVLGMAVSLGALRARYRYKAASILGLISSGLVLIIWLVLVVFI